MSKEQEMDFENFDHLSLEDLKVLVDKEAATPTVPAAEKPRDDKGRFAAEAPEVVEQPEQVVYRREIDLGDGAGKEVFEADSIEELLDKIVEAKANATRKIREQEGRLREMAETKKADAQADSDEEFILSQEMISRPTEAVKKAFKKITGVDISDFKSVADRVKAMDEAQSVQADNVARDTAASEFMSSHPEYVANPSNGKRLFRATELLIGEAKAQGQQVNYGALLERAYTDLAESGLLETKSGATAEPDTSTGAEPSRIEKTEEVVTVTQRQAPRKSSSLVNRGRTNLPVRNAELSEDELEAMPLDQLKDYINKRMRQ